jgi:hypothetical protein
MWALSAQLSIAQSDKAINPDDVLLPTCVYKFIYEYELNGCSRRSHFSFCDFFLYYFSF